jgi:hypothetical protein
MELSMTRNRSPRSRLKNHIVTYKEEEVPEGDIAVEEIIFLEKEEEGEEDKSSVIPMERHDTCLGNAPRERKEEVKLTFIKRRSGMLKQKVQKMGHL